MAQLTKPKTSTLDLYWISERKLSLCACFLCTCTSLSLRRPSGRKHSGTFWTLMQIHAHGCACAQRHSGRCAMTDSSWSFSAKTFAGDGVSSQERKQMLPLVATLPCFPALFVHRRSHRCVLWILTWLVHLQKNLMKCLLWIKPPFTGWFIAIVLRAGCFHSIQTEVKDLCFAQVKANNRDLIIIITRKQQWKPWKQKCWFI